MDNERICVLRVLSLVNQIVAAKIKREMFGGYDHHEDQWNQVPTEHI